MYTDASESGYGVYIFDDTFLLSNRLIFIVAGRWTAEEKKHSINVLEFKALRIGTRTVATRKPKGVSVAIDGFIDNTTARAWALKERAPTYVANELTTSLRDELKDDDIRFNSLEYVKSARNFADKSSRKFSNVGSGCDQVAKSTASL